eukprot:10566592-Heterocapsa_arctica.AAC.1
MLLSIKGLSESLTGTWAWHAVAWAGRREEREGSLGLGRIAAGIGRFRRVAHGNLGHDRVAGRNVRALLAWAG